jgi:hypothetical protein
MEDMQIDELASLQVELAEASQLVASAAALEHNLMYKMMQEELQREYQRLFTLAMSEEDAVRAKNALDRMKSVSFASTLKQRLTNIAIEEVEHLKEAIESSQESNN